MFVGNLLRYWLRQQLTETLRNQAEKQTVSHEAESPTTGRGVEATDEPPEETPEVSPPPDVGFVFALGIEAGGTEDLMTDVVRVRGGGTTVCRGVLGCRRVALTTGGMGGERATVATHLLLDAYRPRWIVSAGFAGGLLPSFERHNLLMVDRVLRENGENITLGWKVDPSSVAKTPGVHVGGLLTVDRVIREPEEKRRLGARYGTPAVDMETYHVAAVCQQRGVPLLAVRIALDTVDERLPGDIERLVGSLSTSLVRRAGMVAGTVWNRPSSLKDMYRLKENALLASDRLAKFLQSMVEQLP